MRLANSAGRGQLQLASRRRRDLSSTASDGASAKGTCCRAVLVRIAQEDIRRVEPQLPRDVSQERRSAQQGKAYIFQNGLCRLLG
jgi:hypothetical protein